MQEKIASTWISQRQTAVNNECNRVKQSCKATLSVVVDSQHDVRKVVVGTVKCSTEAIVATAGIPI